MLRLPEPDGTMHVLHDFDDADGKYPKAGLTDYTGVVLYGTTSRGGAHGVGTVFTITP